MSATIESLNVGVEGQVVRRYDREANRTSLALDEAQARELFDTLAPILDFFDRANGQAKSSP